MNVDQARTRLVLAGAALMAAALLAGCGNSYRSVITPIQTPGPAPQPTSYAAVVSASSPSAPGVATVIDYAGDTVMALAPIGPGPLSFTMDQTGSTGYTVNSDGTLTNFPINSTALQEKNVTYSTLASTANPIGLFSPSSGLWAADLTGNNIDVFVSSPATFNLAIPVAPVPIMVIGNSNYGQRNFAISQVADSDGFDCNSAPSAVTQTGLVTPIETGTHTTDAPIAVGLCPVYAVPSGDGRRLFVMNRGSDTVSVINTQDATLDTCTPFQNQAGQTVHCHPTLPLSTNAVTATGITPPNGTAGMSQTAGPVYAEYNNATGQLVVANYDGGTISIIDVSLDDYGNDSATFGATYTVKVGNNPAAVTVLNDGSRAYTANQADGTVSIVNMSSHTVEKTLSVVGNPRTVVSTQNSTYGKVYVASPNSEFLTVITTTSDTVDTTILVEGNIMDVRTSTQNGNSGNSNNVSRRPGYGQPCYLPPSLEPAPTGSQTLLNVCQTMPLPTH
jgi:YVTN family beta-propeller protein